MKSHIPGVLEFLNGDLKLWNSSSCLRGTLKERKSDFFGDLCERGEVLDDKISLIPLRIG